MFFVFGLFPSTLPRLLLLLLLLLFCFHGTELEKGGRLLDGGLFSFFSFRLFSSLMAWAASSEEEAVSHRSDCFGRHFSFLLLHSAPSADAACATIPRRGFS